MASTTRKGAPRTGRVVRAKPAAKRARTAARAAKKGPAKQAAARKAPATRPVPGKDGRRGSAADRVAPKGAARRKAAGKRVAPKRVGASKPAAKPARQNRSRVPKTQATDASVLTFLERVPDPATRADCIALNALLSQVTGAPPRMWGASIVGFGQYRYRYSSGHEGDWPVCGYSPRKQNLTVYVMAGFERFPDIMARLGRYKTGKSCLYINRLADVDAGVLRELVAASNAQLAKMYG